MAKVLIETKDLVKKYGEGEGILYALNNVSLKVYENEFLVIVGGSGSGKSTLLNVIGGMDRADSGELIVNGEHVEKFNDVKLTLYRRNTIGFVYQFFNLLNDLTVFQNVILSPGSRDLERAKSLLESMDLLDKKDKFPRQLSGGQQQRVAIARALNKDSNILLCDEPTGALDDASGKAVLNLLLDIHKQGKTVVLVTHTKEIAQLADRVVTMKDGKIVSDVLNKHKVKVEEVQW